MWGSSKTKKRTPEKLGNDLSPGFLKVAILPIVEECLNSAEKDQRNWRFKIKTESNDDIALAKEWILFEFFIYGQAILGYFQGDAIGQRIMRSFNTACASILIKYNIFDSLDEFGNLLKQRCDYYLDTLNSAETDNTFLLAKRILAQISGGENNILYANAISGYYFRMSLAYDELVRDVMKETHLVD